MATIGPMAAQQASSAQARRRPARGRAARRSRRRAATGAPARRTARPKDSRATEPLYGTGTARPAGTTYGGSAVVVVGGREHGDLVAEPRSAPRPGRGRGTARRRARPRSTGRRCRPSSAAPADRPRSRSASHSRWSMCQSCGCSAMPRANASATPASWRRLLGLRARRRDRDLLVDGWSCRSTVVPYQSVTGQQRGAGRDRQGSRPGRHPGRLAEEAPPRRRSRSGRGRRPGRPAPPSRSRSGSVPNGRAAAGQRQHLHARATRGRRRTGRTATRA